MAAAAAAAMAAHRASFPLRLQQILAGSRAVSPAIKVESEPVSPLFSSPSPASGLLCLPSFVLGF
jgi:hypothetical protein